MTNSNTPLKIETYLDIETDGIAAGCNVWEIGAVICVNGKDVSKFSTLVTPQGGNSDPDTIQWLKDHDLYDKYLSAKTKGLDLDTALDYLEATMIESLVPLVSNSAAPSTLRNRHAHTVLTWGNFDIGILQAALNNYKNKYSTIYENQTLPWHYGSACSLRDVHKYHNLPYSFRPDTRAHEALADAEALLIFRKNLDEEIRKTFQNSIRYEVWQIMSSISKPYRVAEIFPTIDGGYRTRLTHHCFATQKEAKDFIARDL